MIGNGRRLFCRKQKIYVDDEKIRLLTKQCRCMIVPGVGFVAADDHDGRLMRWAMKQMAKSRNIPEGI